MTDEHDEELPFDLDAETGFPLLPAQRAIGLARVTDEYGRAYRETVVLPNLVLNYLVLENGVRAGEHIIADLGGTRDFLAYLPERKRKIDSCECEFHHDKTLEILDPEVELGGSDASAE